MKLAKRIATVLIILALVVLAVRAVFTVSKGVDGAKEFFYGLIGKDATPISESYSKVDGYVTETKKIPLSGIEIVSLEIDAAQVKLKTGGGNDIIVEAKYDENTFFAENVFSAKGEGGTAAVSLKQRKFGFTFGKKLRQSTVTVTVPEKFKGLLSMDLNAGTFDGDSGSAAGVALSANAVKLELRGISGKLTAVMNACDSEFSVRGAGGDLSVNLNAGSAKINLPVKSNYRVSNTMTVGQFSNNYDRDVNRTGKEYKLDVTGAVATVKVSAVG